MKNIIWFLLILIGVTYALSGIYVYSKKKLRKNVNLKEVWQLFWIVMILRVGDVLSTIYFTKKLGIEAEINIFARVFMFQFGIILGIILISLLSIPFIFFWFVLINYFFRNNKTGWTFFKVIWITISVIVILINLS